MNKELRKESERIASLTRCALVKSRIEVDIKSGKSDAFAKNITHHLIICTHQVDDIWIGFSKDIGHQIDKLFTKIDKHYYGPNHRRKNRSKTKYIGQIENKDSNNPHIHIALCFNSSDEKLLHVLDSFLRPIFNRADIKLIPVKDTIEDKRRVYSYVLKDYAFTSIVKNQHDTLFSSDAYLKH